MWFLDRGKAARLETLYFEQPKRWIEPNLSCENTKGSKVPCFCVAFFSVAKPGALETRFAPISVAILAQAILTQDLIRGGCPVEPRGILPSDDDVVQTHQGQGRVLPAPAEAKQQQAPGR